jgi:hypothetical protein
MDSLEERGVEKRQRMFDRLTRLSAVLIGLSLIGPPDAFGAWPQCTRLGETGCYKGMFYRCQQLDQSILGFIGTGQTCPPANCAESEKALTVQLAAWIDKCRGVNNDSRPLLYHFCINERLRLNNVDQALVHACQR